MLVNTIEFNGEKAVLNSYSEAYVAAFGLSNIEKQQTDWTEKFPNAKVETEDLSETEICRLVAEGRSKGDHLYYHSWAVGKMSQG